MATENFEIFKTRAGLLPSEKNLPYSVTTRDVEEYLQKRVDAMVKASNEEIERETIKVYTTESSSVFMPFVVVFQPSVLDKKIVEDNDVEDIFNPKNGDTSCRIKMAYYNFFKSYFFTGKDISDFGNVNWRSHKNISRETGSFLYKLSSPKIMTIDKTKVVVFTIDPLRVFHDMTTRLNDNRPFFIEITGIHKIEGDNFKYNFNREVVNHNKKDKKGYHTKFMKELNDHVRGRK